ncbi:hypothetical protein ACWEPC_23290, partial [Nonomuraea sp. NPDC004297]
AKLGTTPVPAESATPQAHRTKLQEQLGTWALVAAGQRGDHLGDGHRTGRDFGVRAHQDMILP